MINSGRTTGLQQRVMPYSSLLAIVYIMLFLSNEYPADSSSSYHDDVVFFPVSLISEYRIDFTGDSKHFCLLLSVSLSVELLWQVMILHVNMSILNQPNDHRVQITSSHLS